MISCILFGTVSFLVSSCLLYCIFVEFLVQGCISNDQISRSPWIDLMTQSSSAALIPDIFVQCMLCSQKTKIHASSTNSQPPCCSILWKTSWMLRLQSRVDRKKTKSNFWNWSRRIVPQNRSSVVWRYFEFRASDVKRDQIICRECMRLVYDCMIVAQRESESRALLI